MKRFTQVIFAMTILAVLFLTGCSEKDLLIDNVGSQESTEDVSNVKIDESKSDKSIEKENKHAYEESDDVLSELKYLDMASDAITTFSDSVYNVNQSIASAIEDPSLLKNEEWLSEYEFTFYPINLLIQSMNGLEDNGRVPKNLYDLHVTITDSLSLMEEAGIMLSQAVRDDMNLELYDEGLQMMKESANKMDEVSKIINEKSKQNMN